MKKIIPLILTAGLLAGCSFLTGCGNSSDANLSSEELYPYGTTLTFSKTTAVPIQYDKQYLDDSLAEAVAKYYHSIAANDAKEFSESLFPMYHTYELDELYSGLITDEDLVTKTRQTLASYYEKDFSIAMVDVTYAVTEDNLDPTRDAVKNMLIDLAADEKVEDFDKDLDGLCQLEISLYLTDRYSGEKGETDFLLSGGLMYGVHYQNEWYVMYIAQALGQTSGE